MLEVFINFVCAFMLAIVGKHIIQKVIDCELKWNITIFLWIVANAICVTILQYIKTNAFSSLFSFIINIITYKFIFRRKYSDSLAYTSILMIVIYASELLWIIILVNFFTMDNIQENMGLYFLVNIIIMINSLLMMKIKLVKDKLSAFYQILIKNEKINSIIFIMLFAISLSSLLYNITMNFEKNVFFLSNIIITTAIMLFVIVYLHTSDKYNKLSHNYDVLLTNVTTFENWIEQEQFVRHEYKNQLAYLYELSGNKKVKEKIQEIINQNLDIDNSTVYALRNLPKGGLKGIMYYKSIVAQNNKINLTVDVSINSKGILSKLNKEQINSLSKIVGILFDNAIEASKSSKKKIILLEIYELKGRVNIVLSNTFKLGTLPNNRFDKGSSSKGKGRGQGLYFAKKILNKNSWIKEKQEIIDNYYIETLSIYKNTSK